MERRYDQQFQEVFEAIRELITRRRLQTDKSNFTLEPGQLALVTLASRPSASVCGATVAHSTGSIPKFTITVSRSGDYALAVLLPESLGTGSRNSDQRERQILT